MTNIVCECLSLCARHCVYLYMCAYASWSIVIVCASSHQPHHLINLPACERNKTTHSAYHTSHRFNWIRIAGSSKRISNAMSDITSGHSNNQACSPNSNLAYHRQSLGNAGYGAAGAASPGATGGTPRRSWSSFAFNNKNFPDGKLNYECNQQQDQTPQYHSKHLQSTAASSSSIYGSGGGGKSSANANSSASGAPNSGGVTGTGSGKGYGLGSAAARNRFERSGQDVMARASQIVM